jgi:hypothetical protein
MVGSKSGGKVCRWVLAGSWRKDKSAENSSSTLEIGGSGTPNRAEYKIEAVRVNV